MLTKPRYTAKEVLRWTRWETLLFVFFGAMIVALREYAGLSFLELPWTPIAVIGTAVAFIIGFQNNAAYGRIWEARKIWGGVVNTSRTWGMKVQDMVNNHHAVKPVPPATLQEHIKTLVYRHIAWLTALRHAMRQPRKWEVYEEYKSNREFARLIHIPEKVTLLEDELLLYLSEAEIKEVMSKNNKAVALLYLQSAHIRRLKEQGLLWDFSFLELEKLLEEMFTLQGKSERIKNFPYPRQYATLSHMFVRIFILMMPFGIIPEFTEMGQTLNASFQGANNLFIWLSIPFYTVVAWVFSTMQRISTVGDNPFEGSSNDVPISTISRGIEIDLRQMLGEGRSQIPKQFPELYDVQM